MHFSLLEKSIRLSKLSEFSANHGVFSHDSVLGKFYRIFIAFVPFNNACRDVFEEVCSKSDWKCKHISVCFISIYDFP